MKIFCQAIQAVTVEFCGVALVVSLLVGGGSLGYRASGLSDHEDSMLATSSRGPKYSRLLDASSSDRSYFGHSYVLASRK